MHIIHFEMYGLYCLKFWLIRGPEMTFCENSIYLPHSMWFIREYMNRNLSIRNICSKWNWSGWARISLQMILKSTLHSILCKCFIGPMHQQFDREDVFLTTGAYLCLYLEPISAPVIEKGALIMCSHETTNERMIYKNH